MARQFLKGLGVPAGSAWLDVGCGTGALTETILQEAAPHSEKGIDTAEGHITYARRKITDPRASFQVGDDAEYHAVVSGFVLNFVSQPEQMAAKMARAVRRGGIVAL